MRLRTAREQQLRAADAPRHVAAAAGVSSLPASSADKEALAAYLKVQNGSDVRGVAIDTKPSGKVPRLCLLAAVRVACWHFWPRLHPPRPAGGSSAYAGSTCCDVVTGRSCALSYPCQPCCRSNLQSLSPSPLA